MPIYEFHCKDCNAVFETLSTSASAGMTTVCPQCRGENVKKIMSAGSFKLSQGTSPPACGSSSSCAAKRGFS